MGREKGPADFLKLAELLDSSKYAIVLVGLNGKQLRIARGKAVGLRRVDDASELAKIYSSADVFLNPGTEETFGMNVAEAVACGTRAIVMRGSACAEVADNLIETFRMHVRLPERSRNCVSSGIPTVLMLRFGPARLHKGTQCLDSQSLFRSTMRCLI